MNLFGRRIELQCEGCRDINGVASECRPYVNLYVQATNRCNAACPFCSQGASRNLRPDDFDIDKLEQIIDEIARNQLRLNRLNLTGGEPSIVPERIQAILEMVSKRDELTTTQIQLNTNCLSISARQLLRHPRLDVISISRHHYDDAMSNRIFGVSNAVGSLGSLNADHRKINISCNLIPGFIDNPREAKLMMDYAVSQMIPRLGFIQLRKIRPDMPIVDIEAIRLSEIPGVTLTHQRIKDRVCQCSNYIYANSEGMLEVYVRNQIAPAYCASSLLYDGQHLRQGFHGNNLIF